MFDSNTTSLSTLSSTMNGLVLTLSSPTGEVPTVPADTAVEPSGVPFVIVPLGVVIIALMLSAVAFLLVRKRRLDRLRHHLMPLYNFDPTEEGEDWEAELLDEGMDHHIGRRCCCTRTNIVGVGADIVVSTDTGVGCCTHIDKIAIGA
uniref:Small integral membrane protein 29 n=1 Tax=Timema cristinae TaxID=61476 RepID=A0A7R9DIU5_TIMCR|nr:unnamed protein product [Timema cristinae]